MSHEAGNGILPLARAFAMTAAFGAPALAQEPCVTAEGTRLTAGDAFNGDYFGISVALSGQRILVGAPGHNLDGYNEGAAYTFLYDGQSWRREAKLVARDKLSVDLFGHHVALCGTTALVGIPGDDHAAHEGGAAYLFEFDGSTWQTVQKLTAPDAEFNDEFGLGVALSGDTAIVGSFFDDEKGFNSGSAYVFTRSGGQWSQQAKLTARDGSADSWFGYAASLWGDTALIGARHAVGTGTPSGAAYVFTRSGTTWTEQAKLVASDAEGNDQFGLSVSLVGDRALVGAWLEDDGGVDSGAAYVFERVGTEWFERAKLKANDGSDGDQFGASVSLAEDAALIGASRAAVSGIPAGAAYLFQRVDSAWTQAAKLESQDPIADFGVSCALEGDTAVVGAFLDDAAGPDAGAAYAYELTSNPAPQVYCTAKTGLVCGVPSIRFAGSPSASTPHGFVVAARPALPNRLGVMLYSARGRTATPFEGGLLCVKPPLRRSVAMTSAGPAPCDGVFSIDWNAFAHGLLGGTPAAFLLRAGQQVHLQVWGRDSVATGSYLSPGLEYFVCD